MRAQIITDKTQSEFNNRRLRVKQAENNFRRAVNLSNRDKKEEAIELGREALFHARYHSPALLVDCHTLMATLHMDLEKFDIARIHVWEAMELLDPSSFRFGDDMAYLKALQKSIDKKAGRSIAQSDSIKKVA